MLVLPAKSKCFQQTNKNGGKLLAHQKACCFSGSLFVFFERGAKGRRQIELLFSLGKLFLVVTTRPAPVALSPPIAEMSGGAACWLAQRCGSCSSCSPSKQPPVGTVAVRVVLLLQEERARSFPALLKAPMIHLSLWDWRLELAWRQQKKRALSPPSPSRKRMTKGRIAGVVGLM